MTVLFESDWVASSPYFYNNRTGKAGPFINDVVDCANLEIESPSAACENVIGISKMRLLPSRVKISCGVTDTIRYKSPAGPPFLPGLPCPLIETIDPLSIPAGMVTEILTSLR